MAGAAVAMIQKTPDARPWGLAILVLCLVGAGLLFWWSERIVDRREQFDLRRLGKAYVRILNTTGQLLAEHLETVAAKGDMKLGEMRAYVLKRMAEDLDNQARGEDEDVEWAKVCRDSIHATADRYKDLADVEVKEGYFPPDALPEEIKDSKDI
jgi:hypothetical protein